MKFENPCGGSHEGGDWIWDEPNKGDLEPAAGEFLLGYSPQSEDRFLFSPLQTSVFILLVSYLLLAPDCSLLICPADFLLSFSGLILHLVATCFQPNPFLPRGFRFLVTWGPVAGQLPEQGRDIGIQTPCAADEESTTPGAT